jgi:hypothetical protein
VVNVLLKVVAMDMTPIVTSALLRGALSNNGLFQLFGSVYLSVAWQGSYALTLNLNSTKSLIRKEEEELYF